MQDIIYVGVTVGFFALCVAYVRGLDRLVRGGEEGEPTGVGDPSSGAEVGELVEVRS